jgi:hypothetical protein
MAVALLATGCGRSKIRSAEDYLKIIESPGARVSSTDLVGNYFEATSRYSPSADDLPLLCRAITDPAREPDVRHNCYVVIHDTKKLGYRARVFDAVWASMTQEERAALADRAPMLMLGDNRTLESLSTAERLKWIEHRKAISDCFIVAYIGLTGKAGGQ